MRNLDWELRLAGHFESSRDKLFEWGVFDCALAVCDAVLAMTGVDPGAEFRGKYSTEKEALTLLGDGLGAFVAPICARHNWPEIRPTFAQRGDVVLIQNGDPLHALGIVGLDGRHAFCVSDHGLVRMPMRTWLRAWRIS